MTSIQPQLWMDRPAAAVAFYRAAFGATVLLQVGEGEDVVAQLDVGGAVFWVGRSDMTMQRLSPTVAGGATGRTLLVVTDPDAVVARAVAAGATLVSAAADEHGWRLGRVADPQGHVWEIGQPLAGWRDEHPDGTAGT